MKNADLDFDAYGRAVLAGEIVVGKWCRLAVERHYRDLETGHERGLIFSELHARHVLAFFDFLRHSKDKWAGEHFLLSPWQAFWLAVMFGWLRTDGNRRFRKAYWRVARKNGKSTLCAGIGLYLLAGDGVAGAEIYTAATKLDQAKITHSESKLMVWQSPELRRHIGVFKNSIFIAGTASKYEPIAADAKTLDGLNPHGIIVDELHAHPSRDLWDVLDSATGAREQPLMFAITTAGFNGNESICVEEDNYVKALLQQTSEDDAYFGVIYELDEEDQWDDESCWIKANPNLGASATLEKLREAATKARNQPSALENFLTKHLNRWVRASSLWMPAEKWRACGASYVVEDLDDAVSVYGGLDLASTSDLTSFVICAEMPDKRRRLWGWHYLPEEKALEIGQKNRNLYQKWARQGWLILTPGNVTDYEWVKRDIMSVLEKLPIKEIAFDRWNASQLVNDLLAEGAPMVGFGQGYVSMSPAMKDFERYVLGCLLEHPNDPVLTWAMGNLVATKDPAGNIKPDKAKSADKIDPSVASIMAVGRSVLFHEEDMTPMVW